MDPITVQLLIAVGGVVGSALGAWVAVKVHIAVLESRMEHAEGEIKSLRDSRHAVADRVSALQLEVIRLKGRP